MPKPFDHRALKELLDDPQIWCGVGIVVKRPGESSHWEMDEGDVLVECDLAHGGQPLTCRLGGLGGGQGSGVWRIPPPGTEVAILIPTGSIEQADPLIVAVLSSGGVPDELDEDTLVVRGPKVVVIASEGDDIRIDSGSGKKVQIQGGGPAASRVGDRVAARSALSAWMAQVETVLNGIVPGSVAPLSGTFSAAIAEIAEGSSSVEIG